MVFLDDLNSKNVHDRVKKSTLMVKKNGAYSTKISNAFDISYFYVLGFEKPILDKFTGL